MRTLRPERPGVEQIDITRRRRPERPRPGADLLYGRNAVAEALRGRRKPRALLLAEGVKQDERIRGITSRATAAGARIERLPRADFDQLLGRVNHQGIALDAGPYPYVALDELLGETGTILALDHLQDPQNLGTLLRAADAAGVVGVVIPADRAAHVTPAVVNASAGAVEHLPVAMVPNLARALNEAKVAGWWAVGLETGDESTDLFAIDLPSPIALVIGSESDGISQHVRKHCDILISIPMVGRIASLNAATAGSVVLFELLRRQRRTGR
ncbi:MAG: 23S rRNA (guanosine(2251)-2'-O)-methyltransferase RlmB [Thermomicrobiales bacterium]